MKVLMYRSDGTDQMIMTCRTVEEAVNCFCADAEVIFHGDEKYEIELWTEEMTEEQFAAVRED